MKHIFHRYYFILAGIAIFFATCNKPEIPENPFDNYNPAQDTVKFIFKDPDSSSIAGLYQYIFKPTCANAGCHDGTFNPDFRTIESSYNTLVFRKAIKQDGKYFIRVKPFAPEESVILARLNNIVSPQMPIQIEPDSDWGKNKSRYISLIEQWIKSGAPSVDGTISKEGIPQAQLLGCFATYRDTGIIERRPLNGSFVLDSTKDTIDIFVAFKHDGQDPRSFGINEIRFSADPHHFDSTQIVMNLEVLQTPFRQIGLYGDTVNYSHKIRFLSKNLFQQQKQVYFRTYVQDQQNQNFELPADKALFSMKKYMSFERY